ncbi:MAG: phosphatidate cytidylyltransferase, partial [Deltaproteobacteria bacterium]|nr:phosphatidate cytidylyltransferase [Deltaproteobacteria bacterium]
MNKLTLQHKWEAPILKRILSGIILIPVVVALILYAPLLWLAVLITVISLVALREYTAITSKVTDGSGKLSKWGLYLTGFMPLVIFLISGPDLLELEGIAAWSVISFLLLIAPLLVLSFLLLSVLVIFEKGETEQRFNRLVYATSGMLYIPLLLTHLIFIVTMNQGRWWLLLLLIIVWSNDTFAYFTGRAIGRKKMCPGISPGKTIEGAIGGIVGGIIAALVFVYFTPLSLVVLPIIVLALLVGVFSII